MGRFLPHPVDVPVELRLCHRPYLSARRLHRVSLGGVACRHHRRYPVGTAIELNMPTLGNGTQYPGYVAWCRKEAQGYLIGVAFTDEQTLFGARMGEQVCQIQRYCETHSPFSDNVESIDALARQWVEQHAAEFSRASLGEAVSAATAHL
ncbi:PilZ domain-containing protein [Pseudomonas sp. RIT-To-2]|uniref:PilZ domain-containing protein n=1 Tax=Pseudomonas sp. RIT-To-2 TaxID=3462541 RepID=UPI0024130AB5